MAQWYRDYLVVVHLIGTSSRELVRELILLDAASATEAHHARVRGWPKTFDKILWWLGRPEAESTDRELFLP
jgi:hypothetical protein